MASETRDLLVLLDLLGITEPDLVNFSEQEISDSLRSVGIVSPSEISRVKKAWRQCRCSQSLPPAEQSATVVPPVPSSRGYAGSAGVTMNIQPPFTAPPVSSRGYSGNASTEGLNFSTMNIQPPFHAEQSAVAPPVPLPYYHGYSGSTDLSTVNIQSPSKDSGERRSAGDCCETWSQKSCSCRFMPSPFTAAWWTHPVQLLSIIGFVVFFVGLGICCGGIAYDCQSYWQSEIVKSGGPPNISNIDYDCPPAASLRSVGGILWAFGGIATAIAVGWAITIKTRCMDPSSPGISYFPPPYRSG